MKINRKLQNYLFLIIGGIALIGFVVGAFLDQKITGKMGDFDNLFGILFTALGPILVLAFGVFAGATLFFMPSIENKTWNIIFRVIGAIAVVGFIYNQINEAVEYVEFPIMMAEEATWKTLVIVFISLLDLLIILFSRFWVKKMDQNAIILVCLLIISIILVYAIGCEIVKYLASRPRPRVLDKGLHEFRQWYQWKPFAAFSSEYKDCKSFVSGHTANAACLVTILPLVATLTKKESSKKIQIITTCIGALFTFVVALSRIVARTHWMTDVMGGVILSVGLQAVIVNVTPSILKKIR